MLPVKLSDETPLCPYCSRALEEILGRALRHDMGKAHLHFCPHCRKVLGISHRKGFWMG